MTQHLSPQELVDAADGALAAARLDHLDACGACREEFAALRELMSDVDLAADVPEPSPLFWDHFSQRVRSATGPRVPVADLAWWQSWRTLSLGALLSAAVMLIALQVRQVPASAPRAPEAIAAASNVPVDANDLIAADDGSWDLMVMMASNLSSEELRHVAAPMTGVADTTASDLTPAQQKELVRLIQREMGGAE
jgi:hypothetical protein